MFTNLAEVRRGHDRLVRFTDEIVRAEMSRAEPFVQKHVRENPRGFKHRTGKLTQATKARVVKMAGGRRVIISNRRPYAATLEHGSKPHIIRPRRKKFLRFLGRNGQFVFARSVRHPGFPRGTRFLYRATFAYYRVLGPNLEERLDRLARRF